MMIGSFTVPSFAGEQELCETLVCESNEHTESKHFSIDADEVLSSSEWYIDKRDGIDLKLKDKYSNITITRIEAECIGTTHVDLSRMYLSHGQVRENSLYHNQTIHIDNVFANEISIRNDEWFLCSKMKVYFTVSCEHDYSDANECKYCGCIACKDFGEPHKFDEDGICEYCKQVACVDCGEAHAFDEKGICKYCKQIACVDCGEAHNYDENGICKYCNLSECYYGVKPHKFGENGICTICGAVCKHGKHHSESEDTRVIKITTVTKEYCDDCNVLLSTKTSEREEPNNNTASVISQGNIAIVCSVVSAVAGFVIGLLINKKKRVNK